MLNKKAKSYNSQIFTIAYNRLKLKRREKTIFYRLLGFLIRNDKPFPYSVKSLAELTGYSRRSIFESFNTLESLRLIERIGYTNQVKYIKGRILNRICSLVQKRIDNIQNKNDTLVQNPHELASTSAETAYKKTSSSLKRKEKGLADADLKPKTPTQTDFQEYAHGVRGYEWVSKYIT